MLMLCGYWSPGGHEEYSQDSEYYSHKVNKAGINYELGIFLATGKLIWVDRTVHSKLEEMT